jgi:hypothetical protein
MAIAARQMKTTATTDYQLRLSENQVCEKELCTAGLIALDVHPVSNTLVWCSIHPRRGNVFRDRWLFFGLPNGYTIGRVECIMYVERIFHHSGIRLHSFSHPGFSTEAANTRSVTPTKR